MLNGNEKTVTLGSSTYQFTWDDEDRLTSLALPGGTVDTFTYNGLGLRSARRTARELTTYVCDSTSPGTPVLSDGLSLYTPGPLARTGAARASYYSNFDRLGNLLDAGRQRARTSCGYRGLHGLRWALDGAGGSTYAVQVWRRERVPDGRGHGPYLDGSSLLRHAASGRFI